MKKNREDDNLENNSNEVKVSRLDYICNSYGDLLGVGFLVVVVIVIGGFYLYNNYIKTEEPVIPQVVVTYNSETEFVNQLTIDQVNVNKVPTFNIKNITGDSVSISAKGIAVIHKGASTYKILPPKEMVVSKTVGKTDAVNVAGKAKVRGKNNKDVEKNVPYWVYADAKRELGAGVSAGKVKDYTKTKANLVSLTPVPVIVTDTILKSEMQAKHTLVKELPIEKKK